MKDEQVDRFLAWASEAVAGRVLRCERQGERRSGGRPAFFIDFERDGKKLATYARMARGDGTESGSAFGIEREYNVLEGLNEQGLRVPALHGLCRDPLGMLMENVAGEFDYTTLTPGAERDALDRDFLREIHRLHEIPVAFWVKRGFTAPTTKQETALADLSKWERGYERHTRTPVPLCEFATRWLHRNVPEAPERLAMIQGDTGPGQFIFEGAALRAIIDWEFAHIADPVLDLAQIRTRDFYNPGGYMTAWMQTYAELSGAPIDLPRLRYYTVKSMLVTPLALAGICQHMVARTDHAEWYAQDVTYKRATAEALAEAIGVDLERPDLPTDRKSAADPLFEILEDNIAVEHRDEMPDGYAVYRLDLTRRLARHLRNVQNYGAALDALEAEDRAATLDATPGSEAASERALLDCIHAQEKSDEPKLVAYLYRRSLREEALWKGALGVGEGAVFQRLRPTEMGEGRSR